MAILDRHQTIGIGQCPVIVRNDDDRPPLFVRQLTKQVENRPPSRPIERRRRLVGKHYPRLTRQRTRDCDTLLLPTTQIRGPLPGLVEQTNPLQQIPRAMTRLTTTNPLQIERQLDVFTHRQGRKEVKPLENEADPLEPYPWHLPLTHSRHILTGDPHHSTRWPQNAPHNREERRLATPRWPHQKEHLPCPHLKINPLERIDRRITRSICLRHPTHIDRHRHFYHPLKIIAGSSRVTLLIETIDAAIHITSVTTKSAPSSQPGRKIAVVVF